MSMTAMMVHWRGCLPTTHRVLHGGGLCVGHRGVSLRVGLGFDRVLPCALGLERIEGGSGAGQCAIQELARGLLEKRLRGLLTPLGPELLAKLRACPRTPPLVRPRVADHFACEASILLVETPERIETPLQVLRAFELVLKRELVRPQERAHRCPSDGCIWMRSNARSVPLWPATITSPTRSLVMSANFSLLDLNPRAWSIASFPRVR